MNNLIDSLINLSYKSLSEERVLIMTFEGLKVITRYCDFTESNEKFVRVADWADGSACYSMLTYDEECSEYFVADEDSGAYLQVREDGHYVMYHV